MKAKFTLVTLVVAILLVLGLSIGCSKARSDAQIANDIQSRINTDAAIQSKQITVQSSNGVVTLTGVVNNDTERAVAANDAAQVEGVKTVVNNLQTAPPSTAANTPPPEEVTPPAKEEPPARAAKASTRKSSGFTPGVRRPADNVAAPQAQAPAPVQAAAPPPPAPPAPPAKVTIPQGTRISVRLIDSIDSETAQPGQTFRASLDSPITVDDNVAVPQGADVEGRVIDAKSAGRFAGAADLALELTKLSYNGRTYSLHTNQYSRQTKGAGKATATKVGGGAALGAIIGGLAGGGKGAAIGATVGAGAGTGVSAAHKGQQIKLTSEQVLAFDLQSALTVAPSANLRGNQGRQKLE